MRSLYKFLLVPTAFLLLQSCFVAKDYEQPEVVNHDYFRTDSIPQDSLTMANVSWETMFTDPMLQKYIDQGLKNNIDIRVAIQQITGAQAYLKQGKAGYFPTLSGNASVTRSYFSKNGQLGLQLDNDGSGEGGFDHFDQYELSGNLSWEADIWGKIRSQKRAFEASYLQTVAAHKAVKTQLIANIASTYYQLLALDEQIKITKETVKTRKKSIETTKALKQAGNVTSAAVEQTQAQYYNAQGILVDLKKQSRLLENTLCILLGEEPHSIARTDLEDQDITTKLRVGVPAQLLRNRPDVIAAEYNYRNAFEMTNKARTNFYPSLTIGATGGLQALDIDNLFSANSLFANIVGGLTAPIFQGRKIRTQYEASEAQQEQARLNFRRSLILASKDVSDALYSYQAATEKIDIKEKEYEAYQKATDDSQELLNYGLANYLEVLRARENALNSQLDLINARFSQLNSMVNLYQAVGGGWK